MISCPACKVDIDSHNQIDFENCLRRLSVRVAREQWVNPTRSRAKRKPKSDWEMTSVVHSHIADSISELEAFREHVQIHPDYLPRIDRVIWRLQRLTENYEKGHPRS